MTMDIPRNLKDKIDPPSRESHEGENQENSGCQSQVRQGDQEPPPTKTQEEIDVEIFEKDTIDSGLDLSLSDLEISDDER